MRPSPCMELTNPVRGLTRTKIFENIFMVDFRFSIARSAEAQWNAENGAKGEGSSTLYLYRQARNRFPPSSRKIFERILQTPMNTDFEREAAEETERAPGEKSKELWHNTHSREP